MADSDLSVKISDAKYIEKLLLLVASCKLTHCQLNCSYFFASYCKLCNGDD